LQHSCIVVEGPRLLAEALDASLEVREVFVEDPAAWPGATLVRPGTLDRLGDAVTSQGVLAVVEAPAQALRPGSGATGQPLAERWRPGSSPLVVVLVDVADPGNAGTVLRSAEAAGAAAVLFAGHGVDPLSPKVVRAAAGALFRLPFAVGADAGDVLSWLGEVGVTSLATVVDGGDDLYTADLTGPVAVVLGNEAHGLPTAVAERCDGRLTIPMAGRVESLNVAMAATVVLFEAWRQRRTAAGGVDLAGTGGSGQALRP
jgi:TrmH family RNA methyltransferase